MKTHNWNLNSRPALLTAALLAMGELPSVAATEPAHPSPRERILINDNWRFIKGDPSGNTVSLLYDVRPQWPKPSGAEAQAAAKYSIS